MPKRSLAQLMTWNIVSVGHEADLARAAEVMETARISSVLVVGEAGTPIGIVTERDIVRALGTAVAPEQKVTTVMGSPLVSARRNLALHDAYHLMSEKGVRHLLVTDEAGTPVGIVSESDFRFHLGLDFYRRLRDVRTVMSSRIPLLPPDACLREAVAAMAERECNCVVVARAGKPLGIVTERDAVRFYRRAGDTLEQPLSAVMSSPVATIPIGTGLHEAMDDMHARRIRHLVVVGENGEVAGLLSEHDVVRQLETEYLSCVLSESGRTRQRLHDSEMRRRAVFNQASEFLGILELDGTTRDFNRSALALIGCELTEVVGRPFWETPWWSHDTALQERLRGAVAAVGSGRATRFEATHPTAGGGLRSVDFHLQPIVDDAGKAVMALAEGRDITERKQAETNLRQFQRAVEQCPVSIVITDTEARIQYVNPKFTEITGYSRDEVLGRNPRLLQSGLTPTGTYRQLWTALGEGGAWAGELCNRRKNGEIFWEMARILPITDAAGEVTHFLGVKEDISERRRLEEQRRLALSVFESSHDGILITDPAGIILDVNRAFCELTGYGRDEAIGRSSHLLNSGHHDRGFFARLFATVERQDYWQGELWNRTKSGAISVVQMTVSAVRDDQGRLTHYVGVFTDITQKKESEQRLERLAHYDALTGLPNRSLFRDRLQETIKQSRRGQQSLALLFIDLDHFKEVNDTLGHLVGDRLLAEAARRIAACVRHSDTVARLGGDEFTVILPGLENPEAVERVAQAIVAALAAPFALGRETAYLSASIGITIYPGDAESPEDLTKAADQAMYAAKAQGRNGFSFYADSMQVAARERQRLVADLHAALHSRQFEVHYQPIVDLASGQVVKAEALLRWNRPGHGLVGPAQFIPVAEETGLINDIGEWVFREATGTAKRWQQLATGTIQITINKSPRQFLTGNTHEDWLDHLQTIGLPPACIAIEITEGLLLDNRADVLAKLLQFRDAGVEVALDDFGTGYSALSYLKKFHIDHLKIDRSFVADIAVGESSRAITEAVVVMAHKLGLKVVAEGIETADQRDILLAAGCDYGQGYLFSRALPAGEFEARFLNRPQRG